MRFIAVIDIGKTNAKVAVVDKNAWQEVAVLKMQNAVVDQPPYPHFDVEQLWDFITKALSSLNRDFPIDAVSITAHGACAALLDRDGSLALPILDYEFEGLEEHSQSYDDRRPDFAETGSPRLKMGLNLGAQIYWQMSKFPDAANQVSKILTYPQYWAYRLTGILANEVTSLGCHTDLWNPWKSEFSSLVKTQGWLNLMASVRKADDVLGTITPAVTAETGLSPETPVVCGIHDSNASLYPHLISQETPFSVISSGTWTICMAIGARPRIPDQHRDTLVNVNAFGEAVPSARYMGGREFDVLMGGKSQEYSHADVSTVLKQKTMISPSVENKFGPFQGQKLAWHGGAPRNDGEHYAAISFYLALMSATCLRLTGAEGPTIVEGPFANNNLHLNMLSAATGRPVIVSSNKTTGTSVGAAMLVGRVNTRTQKFSDDTTKKVFFNDDKRLTVYAEEWMNRFDP